MANLSEAWGYYHFDFTKTALDTPAKRKQWLNHLSDLLLYNNDNLLHCKVCKLVVTYFTELRLDDLSEDDYEPEVSVEFIAAGRWNYQNNMEFFNSPQMPKLRDHMLSANGLVMTVEFQDIEGCDYIKDTHIITIRNGAMRHISDNTAEWQSIYPKKYLELGFGDAYESVVRFVNADDLTEDMFDELLKMDEKTFFEWRGGSYEFCMSYEF